MPEMKKQVLSNAIDILINQGNLPEKLDDTRLYGEVLEDDDALKTDCRVYQLSNETGNGQITVYQVFNGIELYYNDMHMAYCNQDQVTAKNIIEINHCYIGRYECSFGENSCCYLSAGDLSIGSAMKKKSFFTFPLNHYHGISIIINLEKLLPEVRQIMELLNINLNYIEKNICKENRLCIVRANPSIEHIFSELYYVREQKKAGYIKIKVLELLLFLSDLGSVDEMQEPEYYNQNQVKLTKEIAAFITEDLRNAITDKTKLVAVTQISNVLGVRNDIWAFAKICHEKGIVIVADGAQSVPHMPVDVQELDVDFLAFSGHKMLGPMGIGVLYGKREYLEKMPPFLTGGEMIESVSRDGAVFAQPPHKFEAGTVNAGGAVGLAAAIDYIEAIGFEQIQKREDALTALAMEKIREIPFVHIMGPENPEQHHGIITFTVDGVHPHDIAAILDADHIAVRAGHHCAQPLLRHLGVMSSTRASLMFYNTEEEIMKFAESLKEIRRKMGYAE
nr:aminotransferase class V-fold PLP-dependent enzyme [uncultured Blautia sp.]